MINGRVNVRKTKKCFEDSLQTAVIRIWRMKTPEKEWFKLFHPANGGSRNFFEAAKLKRMGVVAGVADLVCLISGGKAGFIELKCGKNKLTDKQKAFRDFCEENGFLWAECRTEAEALAVLNKWGV